MWTNLATCCRALSRYNVAVSGQFAYSRHFSANIYLKRKNCVCFRSSVIVSPDLSNLTDDEFYDPTNLETLRWLHVYSVLLLTGLRVLWFAFGLVIVDPIFSANNNSMRKLHLFWQQYFFHFFRLHLVWYTMLMFLDESCCLQTLWNYCLSDSWGFRSHCLSLTTIISHLKGLEN